MAEEHSYDLVVIGAGPGGYVAAIRAAQLGLKVACVEKERSLGGTCLNVGCIPSKALLESSERFAEISSGLGEHGIETAGVSLDLGRMMKRKAKVVTTLTRGIAGLFKKNGVSSHFGHGRITAPGTIEVQGSDGVVKLKAAKILIATGSRSADLPGVEVDGESVGTSTEALSYPEVPQKLVVIGAGVIGLELGSVWSRLGSQVIVLEYLDRILPGMDEETAAIAQKVLAKQGLDLRLSSRVTSAKKKGSGCTVEVEGSPAIDCDRVMLAVGRVPHTEGLGLDSIGVEVDSRGCIPVNDAFETSCAGVFAIGDVVAGPMLAHKAEEEAVACVEKIATGYGHVNYDAIPSVVYTHPEIASVGKTEEALKEEGAKYRKGVFPFMANGRARALGSAEGQVKFLADAETDRLLGVHIIGPQASELIAEAVTAIEFGASAEDIARSCHAHPTLAETLKEAAMAVDGRAIHF